MHDEANPYFSDMIDNMATGHKFLLETFGYIPTIGWQIDPFGHSEANADMYAKMGFDALFFMRVDYQDKAKRMDNKTMEMLWVPKSGTGAPEGIFTHVLYKHYWFPDGFCFDVRCSDQPIMADPELEDLNVDKKVEEFVAYLKEQAKHYTTNNILVTMGFDFAYQLADMDFKNTDILIDRINANPKYGMKLFYSTPNTYIDFVYSEKKEWPLKWDDFFPYADDPHSYWSGYFTSRPTLKGYVRWSGSLLRSIENLVGHFVFSDLYSLEKLAEWQKPIDKFLQIMGVLQHHDAVAGTEKQHVAFDYDRRLARGRNDVLPLFTGLMEYALWDGTDEKVALDQCEYLNITMCRFTEKFENNTVEVMAYNPTFQARDEVLQIPLSDPKVSIIDDQNKTLVVDIVENIYSPTENKYTAYFRSLIPPMSFRAFKITKSAVGVAPLSYEECTKGCEISNGVYSMEIHQDSLWQFTRHDLNVTTAFNATIQHYLGNTGKYGWPQASGAYIFRPSNITEKPFPYGEKTTIYSLKGQVVDLAAVQYEDRAVQHFKLYKNATNHHVNTETWVNSIPIDDGWGKEIVVAFGTEWDHKGVFATDSNGMNMVERKWDYRPTWNLNITNEPTACNFFPVGSAITLADAMDDKKRLTVVNDRAQAGSAPTYDGKAFIELMVHRRLLYDDARGVDEALNETSQWDPDVGLRVVVNHALILGDCPHEQRDMENWINEPIQLLFGYSDTPTFKKGEFMEYHGKVPSNFQVHFRFSYGGHILRVRNMYHEGASIDLSEFLAHYGEYHEFYELSLSENQSMKDIMEKRYHWELENEPGNPRQLSMETKFLDKNTEFKFNPGQVRSFYVPLK